MLDNICIICGFKAENLIGFSSHIHKHNLTNKEYYDKYLKKPGEGICKTCGKPTKFYRLRTGYTSHCCKECISADKEVKDKKINHFKTISNGLYTSNLQFPSVKKQIQETNKKLYGHKNPGFIFGRKTFKEKYNTDCIWDIPEFKEKAERTCLEKYGSKHHFRNLYEFDNITFDSKWELVYYIWLKDHNIEFVYHPNIKLEFYFDNKIKHYEPDFIVENQIVELKGTQFFLDKDPTKQMICSYDRTKDDLYEAKHQCMIQNNVKIITDITEYENYINEKYGLNYLIQFKKEKKD